MTDKPLTADIAADGPTEDAVEHGEGWHRIEAEVDVTGRRKVRVTPLPDEPALERG